MPHINLRVSSQSGHPDLLYNQEWVKVIFFFIYGLKNYIEPTDLVPCDRFHVLILAQSTNKAFTDAGKQA